MREYIRAVQQLLEADQKKTTTKDKTSAFDMDMDDGASKGDLTSPNAERAKNDVPPRRERPAIPGRMARGPANINAGENPEQSLRYLRHLHSSGLRDEISDDEAAEIARLGREEPLEIEGPETPLLPSDVEEVPVTPDNLPQVINSAVFAPGETLPGNVKPPEWHMVKHLPGYLQQGIRAMGRMVFAPFTDTPIEDIQVLASLINGRDVQVMADWIRRNGMKDDEATIRAEDIIPGYGADIQIWNAVGATFMLVKDHAGIYIYGWPGGRGTQLDGPEDFRRLESVEHDQTALEEDFNWQEATKEAMADYQAKQELQQSEPEDAQLPRSGNKPQGTYGTIQDQQRENLPMGDNKLKETAEFLAGVDAPLMESSGDETADYLAKLAGVRPVPKTERILDQDVMDLAILAGVRK